MGLPRLVPGLVLSVMLLSASSAGADELSRRPSAATLETFAALQSRPHDRSGELIGLALRLDTTAPERFPGWYLRLEFVDAVPLHGSSGDRALHAEGGVVYRPRLFGGPVDLGCTFSVGPVLGWIHEQEYWDNEQQPHVQMPEGNHIAVGAAVEAAIDFHVYFLTLSVQTRWRGLVGVPGAWSTFSLGVPRSAPIGRAVARRPRRGGDIQCMKRAIS